MKDIVLKAVIGVMITALWGFFVYFVKRAYKKQKATDNGLQSLLRSEIIRVYDKALERGYCPIYAKEALEHSYTSYKDLGGNGVIDNLYDSVMRLPTKKP